MQTLIRLAMRRTASDKPAIFAYRGMQNKQRTRRRRPACAALALFFQRFQRLLFKRGSSGGDKQCPADPNLVVRIYVLEANDAVAADDEQSGDREQAVIAPGACGEVNTDLPVAI